MYIEIRSNEPTIMKCWNR